MASIQRANILINHCNEHQQMDETEKQFTEYKISIFLIKEKMKGNIQYSASNSTNEQDEGDKIQL